MTQANVNTQAATCTRCGKLGQTGPRPNPQGRLMVFADKPDSALCADCAATAFIKSVETMMYGINLHGIQVLLNPQIQAGFADLMKVGQADATPEEINWQRVVENWDLPVPQQKRKSARRRNQ